MPQVSSSLRLPRPRAGFPVGGVCAGDTHAAFLLSPKATPEPLDAVRVPPPSNVARCTGSLLLWEDGASMTGAS